MGIKEIPWFKWTLNMTFIYAVVTILVLFHKQDFLNVFHQLLTFIAHSMYCRNLHATELAKGYLKYFQMAGCWYIGLNSLRFVLV